MSVINYSIFCAIFRSIRWWCNAIYLGSMLLHVPKNKYHCLFSVFLSIQAWATINWKQWGIAFEFFFADFREKNNRSIFQNNNNYAYEHVWSVHEYNIMHTRLKLCVNYSGSYPIPAWACPIPYTYHNYLKVELPIEYYISMTFVQMQIQVYRGQTVQSITDVHSL